MSGGRLALSARAAPGALARLAQLRDPHRPGAGASPAGGVPPIGAAWSAGAHAPLAGTDVPEALAMLHRAVEVGEEVTVSLIVQPGSSLGRRPGALDWTPARLADVVVGAGFELVELADRSAPHGREATGREPEAREPEARELTARAVRARTLPDRVGPGMRLLVCGLNPSLYAADAGIGFARPGNRFWPAALAAGLLTRDRDPGWALRVDRVGMTDLVKRATVGADELRADEYRAGLQRVERLVAWLRPGAVCVVGLSGWRAALDRRAVAGRQPRDLGGRPVYLMPNTSGLNAHASLAQLTVHLRAAQRAAAADDEPAAAASVRPRRQAYARQRAPRTG